MNTLYVKAVKALLDQEDYAIFIYEQGQRLPILRLDPVEARKLVNGLRKELELIADDEWARINPKKT